MTDIQIVYRELSKINQKFGQEAVASVEQFEGETEAQFEQRKKYLLQDAFRLTVSIRGERDQQLYGEDENIFTSQELPNPISAIYFTNLTAFRRNANNTDPVNRLEVYLDFSKPGLFDPHPLVSEPTPNDSKVTVTAHDITYFRAVQKVIESKLLTKRNWYSAIHRSFAYDIGLWSVVLPVGLILATYYMEELLPVGSRFEAYRWAFFIYGVGLSALTYRFLTSYMKWAFPVNVLVDNEDTALRHRLALAAILGAIGWKVFDAIYSLIVPFGQ